MRSKHTLFDNFEYRGHWCLPENPERKVAGTVRFKSTEGIFLELSESLSGEFGTGVDELFKPKLILGVSENGRSMTLFQTAQVGRVSSKVEDPALFYANYLFLGTHFRSESDIRFSSLSVNFTYFEEWMEHATFKSRPLSVDKVVADYSPPEEVEVGVQKIDARIRIHSDLRSNGDWLRSVEWVHTGLLTIIPNEPRDFSWYRNVLDSFQNLMTLLVGKPVYPKLVSARTHTDEFHEWAPGMPKRERVELFLHQDFRTPASPRRSVHQSTITEEVLLPLPSIAPDLPQILNTWFREAEILGPIYEVFFGALYNTWSYPQSEFLSLMQAAESFHRKTRANKYVGEEKYEELLREIVGGIPESVPNDLKSRLKDMLKYGNEYSLRKSIRELADSMPGREIISEHPDFVNEVVETRHYLTHLNEELKDKALHGAALDNANEELRILLTSLLLKRLDINPRAVYNATMTMINRRWEYIPRED
jgi:hypothetical protein